MASAAQNLSKAGKRIGKEAKDGAASVIEAVAGKAREVVHAAGAAAGYAKDKAVEAASAAAHKTGAAVQTAAHELTEAVRKYPIQSLLIGAALGYLVARAATRS